MGINLQSLKYMAQGFKKVALKDTKGVLTKNNNFKLVKVRDDGFSQESIETILPTGTRVCKKSKVWVPPTLEDKTITITKPNGVIINRTQISGTDTFRITREGADGVPQVLADNYKPTYLARMAAQKKRLNFIEAFNKKFGRKTVKGEDGTVSKFIFDKSSGDMVSWWRKNPKGEVTKGRVFNLPGFGRTTTVELSDGTILSKSRYGVKEFGSETQKLKIDPDNNVFTERILKTKMG